MDELRKELSKRASDFNAVTRWSFESTHRPFCAMTFEPGLLPIGQFRQVENEYIEMLRRLSVLPSTAEAPTDLFSGLNTLWEFFR